MTIPGNRHFPSPPPVPPEIVNGFRDVAVALVSDNMNRLYGTRSLRPYHPSRKLIGTAVTVKTRAGDNLTLHKAFEHLRLGDVLVVDGSGDLDQALVGEIMMSRARAIGVSGFVIDGAIRDASAFRHRDFPCFARGVTHRGPYKSGPGEINVPVAIDGMIVTPGDLILGDEDGVVAFDRAVAGDLRRLVRQQEERETEALRMIGEGRPSRYFAVSDPKSQVP